MWNHDNVKLREIKTKIFVASNLKELHYMNRREEQELRSSVGRDCGGGLCQSRPATDL